MRKLLEGKTAIVTGEMGRAVTGQAIQVDNGQFL